MPRPAFHPTSTTGVVAVASWLGIALVEQSCGVLASTDCVEKATCVESTPDATDASSLSAAGDGSLDASPDGSDGGSDGSARDGTVGVPNEGGVDGTSDVVTPDVRDGGGADASDAVADTGSTTPGCVTSFLDGGGQVLFSFDSAGSTVGWFTENNVADAGPSPSRLGWTGTDGHTCPGAITLTAPFTAYTSDFPDVEFNFGPSASWNATKLHLWVKVQIPTTNGGSPDYTALNAVSTFVQSNAWNNYSFMWINVTPSFSDGAWHEVVEDLLVPDGGQVNRSGPNVALASVQRVGVWLVPQATQPTGGPTAPSTTVLLVDDLWLE
jgi:hypothetical protein